MIVQLLGYAPDADPSIIGVITNASGFVPTSKGFKGAPSPVSAGIAALARTCQGSACLSKLDETNRIIAGTAIKLYEAGAATWSDVSRAASYTGGVTSRWGFAQQGNVSLAANGADTMQASTSGAFSCVAGAPVAAIVETVAGFHAALPTATVYVYDNNSRDRTVEQARASGAVVRTERQQGKSHVVRRMFADVDADIYGEYNCTLCGQVCPSEAIRPLPVAVKHRVMIGLAVIDKDRCIPYRLGQNCIVCEEHCPIPDKAIVFEETAVPGPSGEAVTLKRPVVVQEKCIGCGICQRKCPVLSTAAIVVTPYLESRAGEGNPYGSG